MIDCLSAAAIIGLHNQRISAQSVRNARRPHQRLDLRSVISQQMFPSKSFWRNPGFCCSRQTVGERITDTNNDALVWMLRHSENAETDPEARCSDVNFPESRTNKLINMKSFWFNHPNLPIRVRLQNLSAERLDAGHSRDFVPTDIAADKGSASVGLWRLQIQEESPSVRPIMGYIPLVLVLLLSSFALSRKSGPSLPFLNRQERLSSTQRPDSVLCCETAAGSPHSDLQC